jgi:uncharacterized protein YndB with AHSA1/START domain
MNSISIKSNINAPINKVWEYWIKEEHIKNWNFASPEWHCPNAINNLIKGGEFHYTMAAKDNSMSFDFWGTYQNIEPKRFIEILLGDARKMSVLFEETESGTLVTETFEPETENSIELQQVGWQMILDNFKRYTEKQL